MAFRPGAFSRGTFATQPTTTGPNNSQNSASKAPNLSLGVFGVPSLSSVTPSNSQPNSNSQSNVFRAATLSSFGGLGAQPTTFGSGNSQSNPQSNAFNASAGSSGRLITQAKNAAPSNAQTKSFGGSTWSFGGSGAQLTNAATNNSSTMSKKLPKKFLDLADKLLLDIALKIEGPDRNVALVNLSLVCSRLRSIAQEALIRNAIIYPHHLREYVEVLCKYPHLIDKIVHLELGPNSQPWSRLSGISMGNFSVDSYQKIAGVMQQAAPCAAHPNGWISLLRAGDAFGNGCLSVLLAMVVKISALSVPTSAVQDFELLKGLMGDLVPDQETWPSALFSLLRSKLQVLEIRPDTRYPIAKLQGFSHFQNLKLLSLPVECLSDPPNQDPSTNSSINPLPVDIECVRFYCALDTIPIYWLSQLFIARQVLAKLNHVQLCFRSNLYSFLQDLQEDSRRTETVTDILNKWETSGICLETYFLRPGQDMSSDTDEWSEYRQKPLLTAIDALRDGLPILTEILGAESRVRRLPEKPACQYGLSTCVRHPWMASIDDIDDEML